MTTPEPEPPQRRRVPWGLIKILFAAGVLLLVVNAVPWRDNLIWSADDGEASVPGVIEGEWTADRIAFAVEPGALDAAEAPPSLRALFAGSDRAQLERGGAADWRPGMLRVFREMRFGGVLAGLFLFPLGVLFTATRWWRLLAAAGCPTSLYDCVRLTFLGAFFNLVMPGLTGGDLVKAVLAAREHPERRAAAVVSVAMDRLIGLFLLALLAALVILAQWETFEVIRTPVILCLGGGVLGAIVYANGPLRRLVRFDGLVARLPGGGLIKKVDEAVLVYSKHPREVALALLLSLGNHTCVFLGVLSLARSFGESTLSWLETFAVVSIANIVSALPVAPAGWGMGEAAYGFLFDMLGASPTLGIATSVTFRLLMMALGLLGGLFLLAPGGKDALEAARE